MLRINLNLSQQEFTGEYLMKMIINLEIDDIYGLMQDELVRLLKVKKALDT